MIKVYNKADENTAKVEIMTDIGQGFFSDGFTLDTLKAQIGQADPSTIEVEIKSYGGDLFEGFAIYDYLRNVSAKVITRVVGASASAATIIAAAGDQREITANSRFFVHRAQQMVMGNAEEIGKTAEELEKYDKQIVDIYVKATGKSRKEITDLLKSEQWLSAAEAKSWGFVDKITKEKVTNHQNKNKMDTEEIKKALGVEEDDDILQAIKDLKAGKEEAEKEIETLKTTAEEKAEEEDKEMVEDAVKNKVIPAEAKEHFLVMAKTNREAVRAAIKNMKPAKPAASITAGIETPPAEGAEEMTEAERESLVKVWNAAAKANGLAKMKATDPKRYAKAYFAKFGRELK